jgi:replicative DNA helicase
MTSGLQAGDLIILAARPSMGKTSLAINIAEHVALNEGLPVAVFSMEMGASQLAVRIVGSIGRIDQGHLRTGKLTDDEWPRLTEAIEKLRNVSLHIDETPGLSTSELRANARRLARQCGGKLGPDRGRLPAAHERHQHMGDENRATAVGEISRGLKMLAKELKCPVIALSQLSRGVEQRTDKRPMMSDLRESGAIEQDADIIMFIYRDDYYNKDSKEPGVSEIIISKHRNGPTGTIKLAFLKPLTKFENLAGYSASAETRAAGGSTERILPSPVSMSRASAGSTQLCASRAAATSAEASSCVNISGGSSKPAPRR